MSEKTFKNRFPELVKYWDYDKNLKNGLTIESIVNLEDKFYFQCEKGHKFLRACRKVKNSEKFCNICHTGGRVNKFIIDEYPKYKLKYFKKEENPDIKINYITIGSRKNITWTCPEGHNFKKNVRDFSKPTGTSCPTCRILGIKQKHNKNTTLGRLIDNENLMNEFSKNNIVKPETIAIGNNRTKVLWTCSLCNEDYQASTIQRYRKQTGCPTCNKKRTQSRNEIRLFCELTSLFKEVKENYLIEGYKYDIYIKDINLLIEYDGVNWHSYSKAIKNDLNKNKIAKEKLFNLIRIREKGLKKLLKEDILLTIDNNLHRDDNSQIYIIKRLLKYITKNYDISFNNYISKYLDKNSFINQKLYTDKLSKGFVHNNLTKHPKFFEYDQEKTGIDPRSISCGSKLIVWWKCDKGKDHSWQEKPNNRKNTSCGCPFCSNRKVSITNRLDLKYPIVNKIWSNKNIKNPKDYTYRNGKDKIIWNCYSCNNEFIKTIKNMVNTKGFCPLCRKHNFD